jgi:hypothetical protein
VPIVGICYGAGDLGKSVNCPPVRHDLKSFCYASGSRWCYSVTGGVTIRVSASQEAVPSFFSLHEREGGYGCGEKMALDQCYMLLA